ncbi:MAG: SDR family oxidoreductase [Rhodothermaceae bacterium]|nr:SDR family oxidoreductase [Rhodothermaceae bacterium]MYD19058.1 SDR family oxidoreductase [Rhodothermaceae bacterium]MYD56863.1 SDR family oxidoreductase [Rhodothermaceae bacterium]MYF41354.1 SDR family oxidoreductase [Rhodothermaceae bacterium]MYI42560.1 SDR family oxidoreductase [Rhodothermaceae bacterium]
MAKVIITGASSGIGAAIAEIFRNDGDHQIILLGRSVRRLSAVAVKTKGKPMVCDITKEEHVEETSRKILFEFGPPDVLVNNAGHFVAKPLVETTPSLFRQQVEVNLTGAFMVTRALLPSMLEAGSGHVFFMASVASQQAYVGAGAYCAAKHGLLGLARVVRAETLNTGLRVTTVMPGATLTPSWDGTTLPEERFMPPRDVARSVLDAWKISSRTVIEEVLLRPREGDI